MKIYEMLEYVENKENADLYNIITVTNVETKLFSPERKFIGCTIVASEIVKEALNNNKTVSILKEISNVEVTPRDLIIEKTDTDLLSKDVLHAKANQLLTHQQASISGLMMYDYININNYLADKGYFIHDENREDMYMSILETEDEDLIDQLEIYLAARDEISRAAHFRKMYSTFTTQLNKSTPVEGNELYIKFHKEFMERLR